MATYPSYEEANERQTELLSYGVSGFVVQSYQSGYLAHFLERCLVVTHRAIAELLRGPKYRAESCETVYRTNFRKPTR